MASTLEIQAEAIRERMALPSFSLLALIPILKAVLTCFGQDESNPAMVLSSFKDRYSANPKKTRKRLAREAYRSANNDGTPMTIKEAYVFADATIAQALEVDENVAEACCVEAGVGLSV